MLIKSAAPTPPTPAPTPPKPTPAPKTSTPAPTPKPATTTSYCSAVTQTISASGITLSTNALGSSTYSNNANCYWLVSSPGLIPVLTVTRFATEATYDIFSVFDGGNNLATSLLRTSGTLSVPVSFTATNPSATLYVQFASDSSQTSTGVLATALFIPSVDAACSYSGPTYNCTNGSFSGIPSQPFSDTRIW